MAVGSKRNPIKRELKELYVDAVLKASGTETPDLGTTFMGAGRIVGASYFEGEVDGVRIYNRALSAEEIKAQYEGGRVNVGSTQRIWYRARYQYDRAYFTDGTLSINGIAATWDAANKYWYRDVTQSTVGRYNYTVTAFTDNQYGLTTFRDEVSPLNVIWDALNATNYIVDLENELVYVNVVYCYDSSAVQSGTVKYAGLQAQTNSSGWAVFDTTGLTNVAFNSTATPLSDITYGITVALQNQTVAYEKEFVNPFTVKAEAPITETNWDDVNRELTFDSCGTVKVDVGDWGQPLRIEVNGETYTDWTYNPDARRVTINNLASQVKMVWTVRGGGGGGGGGVTPPPVTPPPVTPPPITPPPITPPAPIEVVNVGLVIIIGVVVSAFVYREFEARQKTSRLWKQRKKKNKPLKWKKKKRFS